VPQGHNFWKKKENDDKYRSTNKTLHVDDLSLFVCVCVFFFFFWCVFLEQEIKSLRSIENDINCEGKRRGVAVYLKGSLKADGIEANHRQGL
jgi:hypothetical protein